MAAGFLRKARAPRRREFRGRCVEQPEWEERPGRNTGWRWRRARPFSSPIGGALENERNAVQAEAVCGECEVIVEQGVATPRIWNSRDPHATRNTEPSETSDVASTGATRARR